MTCAPCQQLWSKAEAGQPDKGVDLLIFQIQVTPSACLTCVRSRFNLHHQIISHTEALGQKLKSADATGVTEAVTSAAAGQSVRTMRYQVDPSIQGHR